MKLIDTDKLRKQINKLKAPYDPFLSKFENGYKEGRNDMLDEVLELIDSLKQEQNSIQDAELTDFESALFTAFSYAWQSYLRGEEVNVVQWAKENSAELLEAARCQQEQLEYKEAVQLVFEEGLTPFKDGNQWCFLLGRNIQDGVCGFGDTILDAAVAFYKDYINTKIHIGELKISMFQQEQPEVDLEKELNRYLRGEFQQTAGGNFNNYIQVARHFAKWGMEHKEQPVLDDSELEKAAEEYACSTHLYWPAQVSSGKGFIAGAKWGAEHLKTK